MIRGMSYDQSNHPPRRGSTEPADDENRSESVRPVGEEIKHWNRPLLDRETITSGNYWSELRVFLAVAKVRSFNKAAGLLNVSTATVSRRVHRLQDALKVELFLVGNHGVQLTPAGMDLAVLVARVDGMLADILRSIGESATEPAGEVRIAITEGISTTMITAPLGELTSRYPEISVAFLAPRNINNLRDNGADMMIALSHDDSPDVVSRRLGTLHLVPMASKAYRDRFGVPTLQTLGEHQFLSSEPYSTANPFWSPWTDLIARGRLAHSCENSVTYFLLAKAGYGIALLSSFAAMEESFIPVDLGVHIRIPLYGIALAESLNQAAGRIAFDWLCDIYSPQNPWFQEKLTFDHPPTKYDESFRLLFNLA